jgi:hypothetical protein
MSLENIAGPGTYSLFHQKEYLLTFPTPTGYAAAALALSLSGRNVRVILTCFVCVLWVGTSLFSGTRGGCSPRATCCA